MKLRRLLDFPEPLGDFMVFLPGSKKQLTFPSTVSYLARLTQCYAMLGLLGRKGLPVQPMGVLEMPAKGAVPII